MPTKQSTENREPHTIRTIHPHPARDRQADRREGDGNRKERKTEIIGHRKQLTSSALSFLIISSEHHARDNTKQTAITAKPPRSARYHSFRLPPRSPCRRAGRDDTASKQHQHRHLITHSRRHRPHLIRSRRTDRQGQTIARQGTGTSRRTSTPSPTPSKQDETLDSTSRLPAPRSEQARSETGRNGATSPAP